MEKTKFVFFYSCIACNKLINLCNGMQEEIGACDPLGIFIIIA